MTISFSKLAGTLVAGTVGFLNLPSIQAAPAVNASALPNALMGDGCGVNIHFTHFTPDGLRMFQESGFKVARMDIVWDAVEQTKGVYNFDDYDALVDDLTRMHVRPLLIIDYSSRYYDNGVGPYTDEGRAAYARYAAAAAAHFKGKHIIWEIWNEPNLTNWLPKDNPDDWKAKSNVNSYIGIVKAATAAIRKADPDAVILAGVTCRVELDYIEAILRSGAMNGVSALSVHPYRENNPETAADDYSAMRALIARYTLPGQPMLPIISSEWGYSSSNVSEQCQAAYIIREYLGNVAAGVNTSVFYDWQNDGPDTSNPEWRYGTITQDYKPKPAYLAVQSFTTALHGYTFRHRLKGANPTDYKLLFSGPAGLAVVEWSAVDSNKDPNPPLPTIRKIAPGDAEYASLKKAADIQFLPDTLVATTGPVVPLSITVNNPAATPATIVVNSASTKQNIVVPAGGSVTKVVNVQVSGAAGVHPADLSFTWNGAPVSNIAPLPSETASAFAITPYARNSDLAVLVTNPLPISFSGQLRYAPKSGKALVQALSLAAGGSKTLSFAQCASKPGSLQAVDKAGKIWGRGLTYRYVSDADWPLSVSATSPYTAVSYLNNKAKSNDPAHVVTSGLDAPVPISIGLPYANVVDWRYDTLEPVNNDPIPAGAKSVLVWVLSDGSGVFYRARFLDDTGQTFQPEGGRLNEAGWQLVTLSLDGSTGIHWGGANDGVPHGQRYWSDFALIDGHGGLLPNHAGTMLIGTPTYAFP